MADVHNFYSPDTILYLTILGTGPRSLPFPRHLKSLKVRVIDIIEPITQSVVLRVDVLLDENITTSEKPPAAILKLYDRRYVQELRESYKTIPPWDPATDDQFLPLLQTNEMRKFGSTYDPEIGIFDESWTATEKEAFAYNTCLKFYNCETKTYDALQTLQGVDIPDLYAKVQLQATTSRAESKTQLIPINGILLEKIDGFALRDLAINAPEASWQGVVEDAIATFLKIDDFHVINEDVQTRNILVRKSYSSVGDEQRIEYKAVFIDFGNTWVKECLENQTTDEEWTRWKCQMQEEGAIGCVMEGKLMKRVGSRKKKVKVFPYTYTPSERYREPCDNDGNSICSKGPLGTFMADPSQTYFYVPGYQPHSD